MRVWAVREKHGNVFARVAIDSNDVGPRARRDAAQFALALKQRCAHAGCRTQDVDGRVRFRTQPEFVALEMVQGTRQVSPERDPHPGCPGDANGLCSTRGDKRQFRDCIGT